MFISFQYLDDSFELILLMAPGYRSPFRPIPMDPIPDLPFSSDSEHMVHHGGSSHNNTEYQFVKNYEKHDLLYDDERDTESYCKDSWWIEAVKFANDVENKKMTCELGNLVSLLKTYLALLFPL